MTFQDQSHRKWHSLKENFRLKPSILTFNNGPILFRFQDIVIYWLNVANIFLPFNAFTEESTLELCNAG